MQNKQDWYYTSFMTAAADLNCLQGIRKEMLRAIKLTKVEL